MSNEKLAPIRRILFPTDFSPASQTAFNYAERLAAATGAELLVLHVFGMPDFWGPLGKPDEVDAEVKQRLKSIKATIESISVEHVAHGGSPGQVVCWVAQDRGCDQIVMGTHGNTGLKHAILGSVAEYVVRHSPCPVLTVRQQAANEKPLKEPDVYMPMPPIR